MATSRWPSDDAITKLTDDKVDQRFASLERRLESLVAQCSSSSRRCERLEQRMAAMEEAVYGTTAQEITRLAVEVERLVQARGSS